MTAVAYRRPPRVYPDAPRRGELEIAAPPTIDNNGFGAGMALMYVLPALASCTSIGYLFFGGFGRPNLLMVVMVAAVVILSLGSGGLMWWMQRRGAIGRRRWQRQRYEEYADRMERELSAMAAAQRADLGHLYLDCMGMESLVANRRRVWERRPEDPDDLTVALGLGRVPLPCAVKLGVNDSPTVEYVPDLLVRSQAMVERWAVVDGLPVVTSLERVRRLAVIGGQEATRAVARHLVCQLAVMQGPDDLRIAILSDRDALPAWEWAKWLPHVRRSRSRPVMGLLMAFDGDAIRALHSGVIRPRLDPARVRRAGETPARRPAGPHLVVIVDGMEAADVLGKAAGAEAVALREEDGISLVYLVGPGAVPPPGLDARLTHAGSGRGTLEEVGFGRRAPDEIELALCDQRRAERIARGLSPLMLDETAAAPDMSKDVRLVDLMGLGSADAVDPGGDWSRGTGQDLLRVTVGARPDGTPLRLDLKEAAAGGMGPHGLIVGATGSGKSELLRTMVTALAISHDPDALNFIFVDFKGGASFADLVKLPHCAGMITNLEQELTLVDRMQAALYGEQERRQRILREADNADNIREYRARRERRPDLAPLPYLLIVVDEFGELLANRPDFLELFVTIGRVGRSLGMHLLLATQRLDEGRIRGLEGHLRYRVCLRTFSAEESQAVLGSRDAFYLPSYPGAGYLKVDTSMDLFKVALITNPHRSSADLAETGVVSPFRADRAASGDATPDLVASTDMDVVIGRLASNRPPVHQVWLPPLPATLSLDEILGPDMAEAIAARRPPAAVPLGLLRVGVGRLDLPRAQRQETLVLDFSGIGGHLAVVGAPRSGKSTLLRALMTAFIATHDPAEVQLYCADLGGGTLRQLAAAPHVGAVAGKAERARILQVVRHVGSVIDDREFIFREHALDGIAAYRRERRAGRLPDAPYGDVFLIVDDLGQAQSELEQVEPELVRIATTGLNYGVHLVVTANRWADVRPRLRDAIGSRLELLLNDPLESEVGRKAAAALPRGVPGRGLTREGTQFHAGDPGPSEPLVGWAREVWRGPGAPPVLSLPLHVTEGEVVAGGEGVVLGVESSRLEPVVVDPRRGDPHFIVVGDSESGKSNLLRAWVRGLSERHPPRDAVIGVVDYRRQLADLASIPNVRRYGRTPDEAQAMVAELSAELRAREPAGLGEEWAGSHQYLFVDDYDWVAGPMGSPLMPLADLLMQAGDIGFHVVLSRRVAGMVRAGFEAFFQRLRELGTSGLILSGDPQEGPLLGGQRAEQQPPGRGLLVRRRQKVVHVQTVYATVRPSIYQARDSAG